MKIFFRVLNYAPNFRSQIVFFFGYAILGIIFGAFNIVLAMPLLSVLFKAKNQAVEIPPIPDFSVSVDYLVQTFNHYFVAIIVEQGALNALLFVCVLIMLCVLLANTFRYLERIMATKIRVDLVKNMRMDIFRNISLLHIGFFNSERKGDLISRFTNDVQEVETAIMNSLKAVLKEPITIIVYFVVLFIMSPKLMLFTLLVLPVTGGVLAEIIKRLKRQAKLSQESLGRIVNILDETFSGMRVIKAFNARNFVIRKLEDESMHYRKVSKSMAYKNEMASPVSEILGVIIIVGIIFFGGSLVLKDGSLEPEVFLTFLAVFAMIIQPAKNFSNGITSLQRGTASAERIFSVVDLEPEIKNKLNATKLQEFSDAIEFRNVGFAYDKELVLKNINLRIEKGKTIALVGPSGGGKSTLADLIPRFYDPTSGEVLLDGIALPDYDIESLRRQIGVVTQESILFNDTIFNNIAFGMDDVKEEDVMHAAKVANAHEFIIQAENGYQTMIGERGSKLSGGQRQRLSIARAVLKNPPILILDEATSALDSESERLVQDALTNLMKHRTSIVIAHRLSTIQHAHEIIVIQDGQIIERGKHDDLIRENGLYTKLIEIQKV
ncbi:MAG: ABC transporter ATP-binding protein/permease [Cyclobacteriaceae bacterium]|nr:ABC transporter ATP-binding protein/permease [Cyclobacteriaceae bacterium]MDH4296533.1 ABC transporter ATP-binding protein/permease [Cyclobacteriaceae bacterium]MDH5248788.1 ABC transporter ATP-binding protein/permease [Cyclobacteriaceae bacterium]